MQMPFEWVDFPKIHHYYGDAVRQFLFAAAALMIASSPFYSAALQQQMPYIVVGGITAVGLAALTTPRTMMILVADAIVSGAGAAIYGLWALSGYDSATSVAFILRLAVALLFLAAFYFAMKTVRSMLLHQVGKNESVVEFEDVEEEVSDSDDEPYEKDQAEKEETISGD